jgi:hypothetical protein
MYFSGNDEVIDSLSAFLLAGASQYVLASHCAFDIVYKEDVLNRLDTCRFEENTFFHFIRLVLAFSILLYIMDSPESEVEDVWNQTLIHLLQHNKDDIREAALFVLRQLSKGGTVEIEKAVAELRGAKYPPFISSCNVVDEVSKSLQRVSPLADYTDFASAVAALSEYAASKKNENLDRFTALNGAGKMACIAAHCAVAAPQPILAFQADIYPVVVGQVSPEAAALLQRLLNNPTLLVKPEKFKELLLAFFCGVLTGNKAVIFFRDLVDNILREKRQLHVHRTAREDLMTFLDWAGCFSVYCNCGCSFCGHCLVDCGSDAHAHVAATHGGYWGTMDQFRSEFGVIAVGRIRNYLLTVPAGIKPLLEAEIPNILAGNLFSVRPEQILIAPVAGGNRARDQWLMLQSFSTFSCVQVIFGTK